jgi:hypothetical protein
VSPASATLEPEPASTGDVAIRLGLAATYPRSMSARQTTRDRLNGCWGHAPEAFAWITWDELGDTVAGQHTRARYPDDSITGTVDQLVATVIHAVEWHQRLVR